MDLLRYAVFTVFLGSAGLAIGSWAVRTRRLNPFSHTAQLIRRVSDPILAPIETWQLRRGGNPQTAPWWLLGIVVVGGIVLITATEWAYGLLARVSRAAASGPRSLLRLGVMYGIQLVAFALVIRVVASWFGAGRFNRWVRWTYALTDWIVEPLRRVVPPFGMVDVTPLIAWFILQFLVLPIALAIL